MRAAGARLVEVGFHEVVAGAGVRRAEAWEYAAAFGPRTAGVLYVYDAAARPPLAEVVAVAHARGVAGERGPPRAGTDHRDPAHVQMTAASSRPTRASLGADAGKVTGGVDDPSAVRRAMAVTIWRRV